MDCDVFLSVLSLVLMRTDNLKSRCFSEGQVHRALHLIGMCLNEEMGGIGEGANSCAAAGSRRPKFRERAEKFDVLKHLERLTGNQRIDGDKDLLAWVLAKWKGTADEQQEKGAMSSTTKKAKVDDALAEKKKAAAARKAKLLAQMQSAQKKFVRENEQLFNDTPGASEGRIRNESTCSAEMDVIEKRQRRPAAVVALGPNRSSAAATPDDVFTCILCQEDQKLEPTGDALVMAAFVQRSTVLCRRKPSPEMTGEEGQDERGNDGGEWGSRAHLPPQYESCPLLLSDRPSAVYVSSCGHIMHARCWQKFYDDILAHERLRSRMRHPHSFDVEKGEFLCPLCRCLSNSVIPLISPYHVLQPTTTTSEEREDPLDIDLPSWLRALYVTLKYKRELPKGSSRGESGEADLTEIAAGSPRPNADEERSPLSSSAAAAAATEGAGSLNPLANGSRRFYTCPLDQVVHEMDENIGSAFARLFTDGEGSELHFSPSVFSAMNLIAQACHKTAMEEEPDVQDERIPLAAWQACAYTIQCVARQAFSDDRRAAISFGHMGDRLTSRMQDCLGGLIRVCGVIGSNFGDPNVIRSHALKLLSTLLEVDTANLCLLEVDAFGLLVATTFALPSLFNDSRDAPLPSCNAQDRNVLHLLLVAHFVQILLTTDEFTAEEDVEEGQGYGGEDNDATSRFSPAMELLRCVRDAAGFTSEGDGSDALSAAGVWKDLKAAATPFLRFAALFYRYLSGCAWPKVATAIGGEDNGEFEALAAFLGLPSTPSGLQLDSPHVASLARRWANHPNVHIMLSPASKVSPVTYPLKVETLVQLPEDYSELINSVSTFSCPKFINDDSRVPAMCLICGRVICSQSYCCQEVLDGEQVGACVAHADRCGAGSGAFLRIRECKVVLLAGRRKGCFVSPPYLDRYGETDVGLRRGNPLTLSAEKLDWIRKLWLNHGVAEEIARVVEGNLIFTATPWALL